MLMRRNAAIQSNGRKPKRPHRTATWHLVGILIFVLGSSVSWFIARSRAQVDASAKHESNMKRLAEIGARTNLALQRELDLTAAARPFLSGEAQVTDGDIAAWSASIELHDRFPEVLGLGLVRFVLRDELAGWQGQSGSATPELPSDDRGFYCFATAVASFDARLPDLPPGTDLCGLGLAPAVLQARDSGQSSVVASAALFGTARIMIQAPLYRNGSLPTTTAERRSAFIGNVGILVDPAQILAVADDDYPKSPIALTFRDADGTKFAFQSHPQVDADLVLTRELGNGWSVSTHDPGAHPRLVTDSAGLLVVGIGSLISALLALLVYTLATGRFRAVKMVEQRTAELRRLAMHDGLTDLPNRTAILDQIDLMLATCAAKKTMPAVLYMDLDGFKTVNDTFGHLVGDQLLLVVTQRLCSVFRRPDVVGRMGGDEFVALIEVQTVANAEAVAERVLRAMREPVTLIVDGEPRSVYATASVGIATGNRATSAELLRDADLALYRAKAHGCDCYQTFRPEMHQTAVELLELEAELHDACERHEFELHYQPIYNLQDLSLVGVEALLRWNHPVIGTVSPERFIPMLEHNGQIVNVGRWVLVEACRQTALWRAEGHELTISVNVSGRQLDREAIVADIRLALDSSGLDADALTIEITETALIRDATATAQRLRAIKELGVHVSIDDFGTGYCSLAYLQRFSVDGIKIDRSFTHAIGTTAESTALVRTLVQLANDLGVYTLAEGVETVEQLDQLRNLHVDQAQGFLLSRPLSVTTIQNNILSPTSRARPSAVSSTTAQPQRGAAR
jgi:diguanylate cyclase (GGDEF)-like protein